MRIKSDTSSSRWISVICPYLTCGNGKNVAIHSGLYLWKDFIQFLKVSGMPADTHRKNNLNLTSDILVGVFRLCCYTMEQKHTIYELKTAAHRLCAVKMGSLKKRSSKYTVGQLLWCDAAVLCCTISIFFRCEHGLPSSGGIALVWAMPCWCSVRTKVCEVSLHPNVNPLLL